MRIFYHFQAMSENLSLFFYVFFQQALHFCVFLRTEFDCLLRNPEIPYLLIKIFPQLYSRLKEWLLH